MSIGEDINGVLAEIGVSAEIIRTPTNITENITCDAKENSNDPFSQHNYFDAMLGYNSSIVPGDVLKINNMMFLVMNKTPETFESEIVQHVSILYKCNFVGILLASTEIKDQTTYEVTLGWSVRKNNVVGLIYKDVRNTINDVNRSTGKDLNFILNCIVPSSYDAQPLDRLFLSSSEYYRVQDIEKYQYPGIHVLTLVKDDRVVYIP